MTLTEFQDKVNNALDKDYGSADEVLEVYNDLKQDLADIKADDSISDEDKQSADELLSSFEEKFNIGGSDENNE